MAKKKEPDFTHTPLFVRTGLTPRRTVATGVKLTKAGAAVVAFLRLHSSTTTKELARQIGMPHGTLRKVLSSDDGTSAARMNKLLRLVLPEQSPLVDIRQAEALPRELLDELVQGTGFVSVETEIAQKRIWDGPDEPVPVHVQFDQLDVVANFIEPTKHRTERELRRWLRAWIPGGEQATEHVLVWAKQRGESLNLVRRNKTSGKGRFFTDLPYRDVFDVITVDPAAGTDDRLVARLGIGRIALCRRHRYLAKTDRNLAIPTCPACIKKGEAKPRLFMRVEGTGFALGQAHSVLRCFFTPFARPGEVWVNKYHLALDAELPILDVVAAPRRGGTKVFHTATACIDSGVRNDEAPHKTQPNHGMVTGLYFGGFAGQVVVYDKSERLALQHGARPRWLALRDAALKAAGAIGLDDTPFTRIEIRVRPRHGDVPGLLAKHAPDLLSRVQVADRRALYADSPRGFLLDTLAFEALLGHDPVTRFRGPVAEVRVRMRWFWKALAERVGALLKKRAPTSTTTARDGRILAQVIGGIVANAAAHDTLDLDGALAQALPGLQSELEAALAPFPGQAVPQVRDSLVWAILGKHTKEEAPPWLAAPSSVGPVR